SFAVVSEAQLGNQLAEVALGADQNSGVADQIRGARAFEQSAADYREIIFGAGRDRAAQFTPFVERVESVAPLDDRDRPSYMSRRAQRLGPAGLETPNQRGFRAQARPVAGRNVERAAGKEMGRGAQPEEISERKKCDQHDSRQPPGPSCDAVFPLPPHHHRPSPAKGPTPLPLAD